MDLANVPDPPDQRRSRSQSKGRGKKTIRAPSQEDTRISREAAVAAARAIGNLEWPQEDEPAEHHTGEGTSYIQEDPYHDEEWHSTSSNQYADEVQGTAAYQQAEPASTSQAQPTATPMPQAEEELSHQRSVN